MSSFFQVLLFSIFLFIHNFVYANEKQNDNGYTKYIFNSSFVYFKNNNYKNLKLIKNYINLDTDKSLLFIYTPGSLNDDLKDEICSTYNEYAYLAELFLALNKKRKTYFYLNCTHLVEGELKLANATDFPFPYNGKSKHYKIRESLKDLIEQFKARGFKKKQIFLMGHSCGAWHSLYIMSQNNDLANSVIAFSPSCFGPRLFLYKREGFYKTRKDDIKKMSQKTTISSIIFANSNDIRENFLTLKWLKKVKGTDLIKTIEAKYKHFYLNSQVCKYHSDFNAKEMIIQDGHNLHFSKCFDFYTDTIINFVEEKIS